MNFYFDSVGPYVVLMQKTHRIPLIAISPTAKYNSMSGVLYMYPILSRYKLNIKNDRLKIIGIDDEL
jgi:hypothetical protein